MIWVIPEVWTCRLDCWCVAYGEWLLENVPAEQGWQSGQVGHVICEWCCSNWYCVDWIDFVVLPFWGPEFRKGWSPIKDTCANGWKDILGIMLNPQPCVVHLAFDLQFLVPICLSGGTVYWPREDAEDAEVQKMQCTCVVSKYGGFAVQVVVLVSRPLNASLCIVHCAQTNLRCTPHPQMYETFVCICNWFMLELWSLCSVHVLAHTLFKLYSMCWPHVWLPSWVQLKGAYGTELYQIAVISGMGSVTCLKRKESFVVECVTFPPHKARTFWIRRERCFWATIFKIFQIHISSFSSHASNVLQMRQER